MAQPVRWHEGRRLPGVEVCTRYHGPDGLDVGGDWYDVFPVGEGSVGLVLGDVAAEESAQHRSWGSFAPAVRAHAPGGDRPGLVVKRVDRLLQQLELVDMATLAYVVGQSDGTALDVVLAGHPPPLLVARDGTVTFVEATISGPLGGLPDARFLESRIDTTPGSTVVLYSDGLVESRTLPLEPGLEQLRRVLASAPRASAPSATTSPRRWSEPTTATTSRSWRPGPARPALGREVR